MAEEKKPDPTALPSAPPKPAAAAPPPKPAAQPWDDEVARRVRERFGSAVQDSLSYLGQNYFVVEAASITSICGYLKHEEEFNYLVDVTAVDYPKRERRFELVYILYSFPRNTRVRVKASIAENEPIDSVTPVWQTANWLEREVYDMFGIRFAGHPGLKRILLPDGWQGHPLRKDYSILKQDEQWVQENLHIESGQ
jgi:NADH-quinone oxidoreductase subunit C